jgi:hypothetical protein
VETQTEGLAKSNRFVKRDFMRGVYPLARNRTVQLDRRNSHPPTLPGRCWASQQWHPRTIRNDMAKSDLFKLAQSP